MSHLLTRPRKDFASEFRVHMHLMRKARQTPITTEQRTEAWAKMRELQARQWAREAGVDYEPPVAVAAE